MTVVLGPGWTVDSLIELVWEGLEWGGAFLVTAQIVRDDARAIAEKDASDGLALAYLLAGWLEETELSNGYGGERLHRAAEELLEAISEKAGRA